VHWTPVLAAPSQDKPKPSAGAAKVTIFERKAGGHRSLLRPLEVSSFGSLEPGGLNVELGLLRSTGDC